jgi:hypothetical protein
MGSQASLAYAKEKKMTNVEGMTKSESQTPSLLLLRRLVIRVSFVIRHSGFVISFSKCSPRYSCA